MPTGSRSSEMRAPGPLMRSVSSRVAPSAEGFAWPACGGRRMAEGAAHGIDPVIPRVATRQWVLTVPWKRRWLLARRPALANGGVAGRRIEAWYRRATGREDEGAGEEDDALASAGRDEPGGEAGRRYPSSEAGRLGHAARQCACRARVTHQRVGDDAVDHRLRRRSLRCAPESRRERAPPAGKAVGPAGGNTAANPSARAGPRGAGRGQRRCTARAGHSLKNEGSTGALVSSADRL